MMRMDMKRKDDLLPLLSHAQFKEDLDAFVLAPEQRPHSLLFVGLDLFKEINDSFGHEAGDEVLQKVARELSSASAGIGDSYRRGGDEMAIVLPNCGLQEATAIAEGVRARVENLSFERCNEKVTVSIGVASYPETISETSRLFDLADTMMYRAKDYGGNCICVPATPGDACERIIPEGRRYMRGERFGQDANILSHDPCDNGYEWLHVAIQPPIAEDRLREFSSRYDERNHRDAVLHCGRRVSLNFEPLRHDQEDSN